MHLYKPNSLSLSIEVPTYKEADTPKEAQETFVNECPSIWGLREKQGRIVI